MDRYLIIVGGGILQIPAVNEAHKMGLKVVVLDKSLQAPAMTDADEKALISTKDIDAAVNYAKEFAETHHVVGAYTQGTDVELTVACIAKELGLPGIDVQSARDCNNKIEMRKRLAKYNIPGPRFDFADNYEQAQQKAEKLGYPLVVKSTDNSGSRGIRILNNENMLKQACEEALKYSFYDKRILLEEYLEGEEYSVDTIVYNGIVYPCGISDREFDYSKEFAVQTGSVTPSRLPEKIQNEMYCLMSQAAKAMGINKGAFKGDLILCDNKPKILEITARLSGGFDSQYRKPYSFGINLIKATIDIAIGNNLDFRDIVPKWIKYSKTTSPFPKAGKITKISGVDTIKNIKGVRNVFMLIKEGDIVEDYKHCVNRVGYIILSADSYEELKQIEKQTIETLEIITNDE
ncbi:MAG: ATP-grasp domain-containing protein [Bacteroidales bacterium]|jgi:biotin carboxylase|nr:ATP-grasp domain-containing protein [Bacteroidales bacterium]